jgi:hypothetical protein
MIKKYIIIFLIMILSVLVLGFTDEDFKHLVKNSDSYEQGYFTFEGKIVKRYNINASYSLFTMYESEYDMYNGNLVIVAPRLLDLKVLLDRKFSHDDIVQFSYVQFMGVIEQENIYGDYILIPYFEFTEESTAVLIK